MRVDIPSLLCHTEGMRAYYLAGKTW